MGLIAQDLVEGSQRGRVATSAAEPREKSRLKGANRGFRRRFALLGRGATEGGPRPGRTRAQGLNAPPMLDIIVARMSA